MLKLKIVCVAVGIVTSAQAAEFSCPEGTEAVAPNADVRVLANSGRAGIVFAEEVTIPAGQSRTRLGRLTVADEAGVARQDRHVKAGTFRKLMSYSNGHTPGDTVFLFTTRLRMAFEGSRFHTQSKDWVAAAKGGLRFCQVSAENEIGDGD